MQNLFQAEWSFYGFQVLPVFALTALSLMRGALHKKSIVNAWKYLKPATERSARGSGLRCINRHVLRVRARLMRGALDSFFHH
jgi:hypothetical protein